MEQKKIRTLTAALDLADKALGGVTEYGAAVGLSHTTGAGLTAKKNAASTSHDTYVAAKGELRNRRATLRGAIMQGVQFANTTRDSLKAYLGNSASPNWEPLGLAASLQIPRSAAGLKFVLGRIETYLTANPTRQNSDEGTTQNDNKIAGFIGVSTTIRS